MTSASRLSAPLAPSASTWIACSSPSASLGRAIAESHARVEDAEKSVGTTSFFAKLLAMARGLSAASSRSKRTVIVRILPELKSFSEMEPENSASTTDLPSVPQQITSMSACCASARSASVGVPVTTRTSYSIEQVFSTADSSTSRSRARSSSAATTGASMPDASTAVATMTWRTDCTDRPHT